MWLTDVFLIVFGQQWSSVAQKSKIYQALIHTHYLLVDQLIGGVCLHEGFKQDLITVNLLKWKQKENQAGAGRKL